MKRTVFRLCLCLLLCLLPAMTAGCGAGAGGEKPIREGETYLDGGWYNDELRVGYSFFPDGGGFQFIGTAVNPIRYGVYGEELYLIVGDGGTDVLSFSREEKNRLLIGGIPFLPVKDDPEAAASVEALLSALSGQESEESGKPGLSPFFFLPALALAAFVPVVIVYGRKKRGRTP